MNATPVMICEECEAIACEVHPIHVRAFLCQFCLETHHLYPQAEQCCKHLVNNEVLDSRHYAKEAKKVREPKMEYPTALLKGIR